MSKLDTSVPLLQRDIGAIGVVDVGTGAVMDVNLVFKVENFALF